MILFREDIVKSALSLGGDPGDLPHDEDTGGHWWSGAFTITGDEYAYSGVTRDGFQPSTQYNFSITVGEDSGHPGTYATNVGPQTNLADTDLNSPDLAIDETEFSNSSGNMSLTTPGPGGDTTVWTGTITTDASVDPLDVFDMRGTTADGDHSHTHTTGVFFWFDPVDDPTFETVPPAVGTWITQDLNPPDGAQTTFDVRWHFDPNSLQVWVDNTEQTSSIASTDPTAKTFTLLFAPTTTERVKVRYKVAPA